MRTAQEFLSQVIYVDEVARECGRGQRAGTSRRHAPSTSPAAPLQAAKRAREEDTLRCPCATCEHTIACRRRSARRCASQPPSQAEETWAHAKSSGTAVHLWPLLAAPSARPVLLVECDARCRRSAFQWRRGNASDGSCAAARHAPTAGRSQHTAALGWLVSSFKRHRVRQRQL